MATMTVEQVGGPPAGAPPTNRPGPALQVDLLGPPRVTRDGQALALPRRQSRALLYRLAAAPQPVPRDALCFLF